MALVSTLFEKKLANFLTNECGFEHVIHTASAMITIAKEKNLILPDLTGIHKNGTEYFIELKNKNRRMVFNDNGINTSSALAYLEVEKEFNKKVLLVFLDDENEWINENPYVYSSFKDDNDNCVYYGNWITELEKKYIENNITKGVGNDNKPIRYYALRWMKKIEDIFHERQTSLNFGVLN